MCRHGLDIQAECSCFTAESLRSDTKLVDFFQHFFLKVCIIWILVFGIYRTHQSFFCKKRSLVKSTADPYSDNHRRTWIRACCLYSFENKIFDSFDSRGWLKHADRTHVFTSEAFRTNGDFDVFARNDFCIKHCRCIIAGVSSANRIFDNGFTQITVGVATAYSFVYCLTQISSCNMYVLSDFKENADHSGILTNRNLFVLGNFVIFDNVVKDATGNLSVLTGTTGLNGFFDVIRKHLIGFDAKSLDGVRNHGCLYFTHVGCTPSCFLFYCIVSGIFVQGWMKEFVGRGLTDHERKAGGPVTRFVSCVLPCAYR